MWVGYFSYSRNQECLYKHVWSRCLAHRMTCTQPNSKSVELCIMTFYTYNSYRYQEGLVQTSVANTCLAGHPSSSMQLGLLFFSSEIDCCGRYAGLYIPTPQHIGQCRFFDSGNSDSSSEVFPPCTVLNVFPTQ